MKLLAMYLAMCSLVVFGATDQRSKIEIRRISSCRIESSWKSLTDTAQIVLPLNIPEFNDGVRSYFKRGDPVEISLGYNGEMEVEFRGYITRVSATIPLTLHLEDEMFSLKSIPVNKSYQSVTLKQLMGDIAPGYTIDALDIELGAVRLQKTTAAATLQLLKDKGIYSYFSGEKLVSGRIYSDNANSEVVKFNPSVNILDDKNLEYMVGDEHTIKVTAYSLLPGGEIIEVEAGDKDGVESRIAHYGIRDKDKLKELATLDYERLKIDGYKGSFTAAGIPRVIHGQKIEIIDDIYPDRQGTYYVDGTVVSFTDQPAMRREIALGRRAG